MTLATDATDAERAVVGAALLNPDSLRFSLAHITEDDFADTILARVFSLMVGLRSAALPIDPVSILAAARERNIRGVDGASLHTLMAATPTASNADYYARQVAEAAVRRRLAAFGMRALQLADGAGDLNDAMTAARDEWSTVRSAVTTGMTAKTLTDVLDGSDEYDWLIPSLLERMDRVILTGGEGAGKSTFVRQLGILAAAGVHPTTFKAINPVNVLVVDAENTEKQWRRAARAVASKAAMAGARNPADHLRLACISRMDITTERDLGAIHRLIDEHAPDLLIIGPLYRLIPRAINSDDDAAPMIAALDSLRARGIALVMEAHAGHATTKGGDRDLRPRGSSALMGWPEFGFGIALDPQEENLAHLVRWRGDRDERDWPRDIRRGGDWPWMDDRIPRAGRWQPTYPGRVA
ncbi:MAG: AAA family ATPase [Propionibacterium sp.]|nr:AAA family ATPase [Propionibacterium sp.]